MNYENILTTINDRVLTIKLNLPESHNAMTVAMVGEIIDAITLNKGGENVSVIVIEGEGKSFCAGVNLKSLGELKCQAGKVAEQILAPLLQLSKLLEEISIPVIAKVHGVCYTGGLELVLFCDMIYADRSARFADTHVKFGLRPMWAMSQNLPAAVGMMKAKEICYTARSIDAEEAYEMGLITALVDTREELDQLVADRTAMIVNNSPEAIGAYKDLFNVYQRDLVAGRALEMAQDYPEITDTMDRITGFSR